MSRTNISNEHPQPSRGRGLLKLLAAAVITLMTALLAALVWLVSQAQYINDYCTTRAPQPPDVVGGRPAYMSDPITVACEFDGYPTVYVTEPGPLFGALFVAAGVVLVGAIAFHWARSPALDGAEQGRRRAKR